MSRDFEGAKAFYAAVFGYEYGDMSSDGFSYATLLINGQQVVGGIGAYPGGSEDAHPAFWGVYFGTADTDKSVDLATSHGGRVIRPATDSPYGRMADRRRQPGRGLQPHLHPGRPQRLTPTINIPNGSVFHYARTLRSRGRRAPPARSRSAPWKTALGWDRRRVRCPAAPGACSRRWRLHS